MTIKVSTRVPDLPVHVELKLEKIDEKKKWFSDTGHETMEGSHP